MFRSRTPYEIGDVAEGFGRVIALQSDLERLAFADPLTGVGNRTRYFADLETLLGEGAPVALLMIDLDRFTETTAPMASRQVTNCFPARDLILGELEKAIGWPAWAAMISLSSRAARGGSRVARGTATGRALPTPFASNRAKCIPAVESASSSSPAWLHCRGGASQGRAGPARGQALGSRADRPVP